MNITTTSTFEDYWEQNKALLEFGGVKKDFACLIWMNATLSSVENFHKSVQAEMEIFKKNMKPYLGNS